MFISIKDMGALYGYGLFETLRIYAGLPFLVEEHIDRMVNSSQELFFKNMPAKSDFTKLIFQYMESNDLYSGAIRVSVTYGNEREGISPNIFITERDVLYGPSDYDQGISVGLSLFRKNEHSPIVAHKTFNYLENIIALRLSGGGNAKECIFLSSSGYLSEGTKSNVFFIRDNKIFTPAKDCGILPGITREHVMNLLISEDLDVFEGKYSSDDLYACDECFCTNSLMEVMPVVKVEDKTIGKGRPGEITKFALSLYRSSVERYGVKQKKSTFCEEALREPR